MSLKSNGNNWWNIHSYLRKKNIVVYFVHDPHCDTCRARLKGFAQDYRDWQHLKTEVVAVLPNSRAELKSLGDELHLPYPLLSDVEGQARAAFTFDQLDQLRPPTVFAVDRMATLYYHELNDAADPWEEEKEVLNEMEFLESRVLEGSEARGELR